MQSSRVISLEADAPDMVIRASCWDDLVAGARKCLVQGAGWKLGPVAPENDLAAVLFKNLLIEIVYGASEVFLSRGVRGATMFRRVAKLPKTLAFFDIIYCSTQLFCSWLMVNVEEHHWEIRKTGPRRGEVGRMRVRSRDWLKSGVLRVMTRERGRQSCGVPRDFPNFSSDLPPNDYRNGRRPSTRPLWFQRPKASLVDCSTIRCSLSWEVKYFGGEMLDVPCDAVQTASTRNALGLCTVNSACTSMYFEDCWTIICTTADNAIADDSLRPWWQLTFVQ